MKKIVLLVLTVIAAGATAFAGGSNGLKHSLDSLFEVRYPNAKEPGASVVIAAGDSVIYERQFGMADIKQKRKIDASTPFNIASISKQFTTIGALRLAEKGQIDINATIDKYFPKYKSEIWRQVKVSHLMSQSSGIPDTRPRHNRHDMIFATDSTSALYFNTLDSLKFTPGTAYDYINPTFILVARIIEQATGLPFVEYQQRNIFDPLGMTSTCYFNPDGMPDNVAHGYVQNDKGKWEIFEYGQIVGEATREAAYHPHTRVSGSPWSGYQNRPHTSYGYGFFIDRTPGFPKKVYHTGDNGGFQAYLAKYPDKKVVIVVLENRNDLDRWTMAREIDRILLNNGLL